MGRSRQGQDSSDLLLLAAAGIVVCLLYLVLSGCASRPTNGEKDVPTLVTLAGTATKGYVLTAADLHEVGPLPTVAKAETPPDFEPDRNTGCLCCGFCDDGRETLEISFRPAVPTLASTEAALEDPWSKERQETADFYRSLQAKRNRRSQLFLTIMRTFDTVISIYGLTQTDLVEAGWFHSLTDAPVVSILVVDTAVFLVRRWLGKKYPAGRFQAFDYTSGSISGAAAVKNLWKILDQRASTEDQLEL